MFAFVVVAFIVVVAIAGFFSWRRFQASPEYSLTLLVDAAQRNDQEQLAKLIDDDEIAKNMIGNVSQKAGSRYGLAMSTATQKQIDKVVASLLPRLKQTVHDEVTKEIKSFAATSESKPFIVLLITVPSLVTITTNGDIAKASARNKQTFELTLRRDAERWKLVGFNDDAVVQRITDTVMKELPAIGALDSGDPLLKIPGKPRKRRR